MSEKAANMVEVVASTAATKSMYAGGGVTLFGWYFQVSAATAIGLIITVLGFLVNFYFQFRRDRRERLEHAARMKGYNGACDGE
ncbi:holin [Acinetobacter baumannii]|uniref:holin n=1 Tax=Acinetobacter baumannii TaxID=470 RepID=UPI003AF8D556